MRSSTATVALGAVVAQVSAFKLNPQGKTVGFELIHRAMLDPALHRRDTGSTISTGLAFESAAGGGDYYVNFTLGTPPQQVAALVDTGSSDTWLPTIGSSLCAAGCPLGTFDPTKSSTYTTTEKGTLKTLYADGSGSTGDYGTDVLQIGGASLKNFTVGVATGGHSILPGQGIIGMGFWELEADLETTGIYHPTLLQSLVSTGAIDSNTFSVYFNEFGSPGTLLFGGIDTAKFQGELGIIPILPMARNIYAEYRVAFSGMSFTNREGGSSPISFGNAGNYIAVLDSGSAISAIPDDIAFAIYNGLGLEYSSQGAAIPCDADLSGYSLNFTFGGQNGVTIETPLSQFIEPYNPVANLPDINGDRACLFGIAPMSGVPKFPGVVLIGGSFFRGAYVVYDLDNLQIAMAPSIPQASSSNVIAIAGTAAVQTPSATPSYASASTYPSAAGTAYPSSALASYSSAYASGYLPPYETEYAFDYEVNDVVEATSAAAFTLANTIPSATTAEGQQQVTAFPPSSVAAVTGTNYSPTTTASPTFSGIPSGGFSVTATIAGGSTSSHSAATVVVPPFRWTEATLSSITIMLMVVGGGVLFL